MLNEKEDVSKLVPKDSISIDGEKLSGINDFTIDARRGKAEIRLLNTNQSKNNELIDLFTDKDLLLQDGMETDYASAIIFSHEKAVEAFKTERLFTIDKWDGNHTWDYGDGTIAVQSIVLRNIFYNTMKNEMAGGSNGNGDEFFNNLTAMFVASILNFYGVSMTTTLEAYHILAYLMSRFGVTSPSTPLFNIVSAFYSFLRYHVQDRKTAYKVIENFYDSLSDEFGTGNFVENVIYTSERTGTASTVSTDQYFDESLYFSDKKAWMVADFLASIFSRDDYETLVQSFKQNNMVGQKISRYIVRKLPSELLVLPTVGNSYYTPFYHNRQVVMGGSLDYGYSLYPSRSTFLAAYNNNGIKVCNRTQTNGLKIGKIQTRTYSEDTDSGVPISHNDENIEYWNNYVPVRRTYRVNEIYYFKPPSHNVAYEMYVDNIKIQELLSSENSFLFTTCFTETNWMYFDSIECIERVLAPEENTFVDQIPLFDLDSNNDVDNYGLYAYRDYFDTYYTKSSSGITDIVVQIKDTTTNKILFTGLVDFNSVRINKKAISFDAIDAIGLLADNARKLNGIVHFSQFDTGGDGTIADKKAGATLKQFAETLIRTPFPYNHILSSPSFDVGNNDGLENKLLENIDTNKALIMAIQCAKKLLYVDGYGKIQIGSVLGDNTATIDGTVIQENISQSNDIDELEFRELEKIAGHNKFMPSVVSFYKSIVHKYKKRIELVIHGQSSEIKLLDKITYKSKDYFVMEKNMNLSNGQLNITMIGSL